MYGSGLPLLYPCAVVSFVMIYWVDKITLLRVYQTPPRFNKKLMASSRGWLTPMLIIHLILGFWMYSNSTIFDSQTSVFGNDIGSTSTQLNQRFKWFNLGTRISQVHSFLVFAAILLFIAIIIFKDITYDLIIKKLKKVTKRKHIGISPTEVFLNDYYKGLDAYSW
jgi:hypothetical protein